MITKHDLTARTVPISSLREHPDNPRDGDVETIRESLREHGQYVPVVVQVSTGYVIKGNHTMLAARAEGETEIDAVFLDVDDDQATRILLMDNAASDRSTYRADPLAAIVASLNGNLAGTGFTDDSLADLMASLSGQLPKIRNVARALLKPHPRNYQKHPEAQITEIAASITQQGYYRAVVTARDWTILAGHGVVLAAERLGHDLIPVIRLDLDPDEPRALKVLVSDNEIGRTAERSDRELIGMLREIMSGPVDIVGTGFTAEQLAALEFLAAPPAAKAGDEWKGMPEFTGANEDPTIVVRFDSEEDLNRFVEFIGCQVYQRGKQKSIRWPDRPRQSTAMVRFEVPDAPGEDAAGTEETAA